MRVVIAGRPGARPQTQAGIGPGERGRGEGAEGQGKARINRLTAHCPHQIKHLGKMPYVYV